MSGLKPIILYSHASGPNPWKVAIILEELSLPYETKFLDFPDLKKSPFVDLNPNGRVPAIEDPNTGVNLWESGAIVEYLTATYDKSNSISFPASSTQEYFAAKQWLYFQVSGQGPYYGQKAWFSNFHPEKGITSAIDRYGNELKRVVGVLNSALKTNGTGYLVGSKLTYADLSFIPWDANLGWLMGAEAAEIQKANPEWAKWHKSMTERPAVKKVLADKAEKSQRPH